MRNFRCQWLKSFAEIVKNHENKYLKCFLGKSENFGEKRRRKKIFDMPISQNRENKEKCRKTLTYKEFWTIFCYGGFQVSKLAAEKTEPRAVKAERLVLKKAHAQKEKPQNRGCFLCLKTGALRLTGWNPGIKQRKGDASRWKGM